MRWLLASQSLRAVTRPPAEVIAGTLVVKPSDVLAQSGHITSPQDLGPTKAVVDITVAP